MHGRKRPGRSDTCKMDLKSEEPVQKTKLACMKSLTLLDPRQGHSAFQLQNFTLGAKSVFSERSNYFSVRWIKTGSGTWDLDLATFSFSSPVLLFAAPYQDILLRSQEPISGVCIRFFMPSFFVSKLTMKRSDATASYLTMFTECQWPVWRRMTSGLSMQSSSKCRRN
jgi:hypothetical protein